MERARERRLKGHGQGCGGLFLLRWRMKACDTFTVTNVPATATVVEPFLRKGQHWNMADQQLRIYRVGILLVEFRLFKVADGLRAHKLGRSSLETIASVQDYLLKHQAVLGKE